MTDWIDLADFFYMGGYGLYVWGSLGACLAGMLIEPWLLRQRRRSQAMSRLTPWQRAARGTNPPSTTQSICTPGNAERRSCTAGMACTTSPSEDSLTIKTFNARPRQRTHRA